jgi:hypothetical protein
MGRRVAVRKQGTNIPSKRSLPLACLSIALFVAASLLLPVCVPMGHAATVTVAWNANSEPTVAGYRLYYGTSSGHYSYSVDVGNSTRCTLSSLQEGVTYYLAVAAYDVYGNYSGYSNEITYPASPPVDFNGDGKTDLLWRNRATGEVFLWFMDGANPLRTQSVATVGDMNWQIIGSADFNGDGKPDLLWRNTATGMIALWYMNGAALASAASIMEIPMEWVIVATADFNGDGKPDFLWRNRDTGMIAVWYMNGATLVSAVSITTVSTDEEIAGTADMNRDGKPDIIWRNKNTGTISVWYMNGATYLSNAVIATADTGWTLIAPR